MDKLKKIIDECLEQHIGGEAFFDSLDEKIKDEEIVNRLLNIAKGENIILTGKFGRYLIDNFQYKFNNKYVVCVRGDLRFDICLSLNDVYLYDKEFVLIDDSYYSGKTATVIENALKSNGACLSRVFVVYDGSKPENKLFDVRSLYSYYGKNNINNICKGCKLCLFQDICKEEKNKKCKMFETTRDSYNVPSIDISFRFMIKKLLEVPVEKTRYDFYLMNKQTKKLMKKERRMKIFKFI